MKHSRGSSGAAGYSLLELLVTTAIAAVVITAGMGLGGLIVRERRYFELAELQRLVHYARAEAVSGQQAVTLCAVDSAGRCSRDWSGRDIAVFHDRDEDRAPSESELLRWSHWEEERGLLQWRAALGRRYLVFSAFGSTYQNGSFYLCYDGRGQPADRVLTVNRGGRPYLADPAGRRCR